MVVGLQKGVICLINMHDLSYEAYNKMWNKFKKLFQKSFIRNLFKKLFTRHACWHEKDLKNQAECQNVCYLHE